MAYFVALILYIDIADDSMVKYGNDFKINTAPVSCRRAFILRKQ